MMLRRPLIPSLLLVLLARRRPRRRARFIRAQLVAEGPAPAGRRGRARDRHATRKPGWHGYWLNPGDAGLPMEIEMAAAAGLSAGPLRYPVPTRLTVAGLDELRL